MWRSPGFSSEDSPSEFSEDVFQNPCEKHPPAKKNANYPSIEAKLTPIAPRVCIIDSRGNPVIYQWLGWWFKWFKATTPKKNNRQLSGMRTRRLMQRTSGTGNLMLLDEVQAEVCFLSMVQFGCPEEVKRRYPPNRCRQYHPSIN